MKAFVLLFVSLHLAVCLRAHSLEALRKDDWKLRLASGELELFNLQLDPSERYNQGNEKHEIVRGIYQDMLRFSEELGIEVVESN